MSNRSRAAKPMSQSPTQQFLTFIEKHELLPLEQPDENLLFVLDLAAATECAQLHIVVPEFGSGSSTPGMKLSFYRESQYKYPGALYAEPRVPEGETEYYRICLDPHEDWKLWLRAVASMLTTSTSPQSAKKRPDRLADIQRLQKVVVRLLREAANHAAETWSRTGEPEILPRRDQKDVGLEIGLSESTTSRCFSDESADQLRAHWEMLLDRDRILSIAESSRKRVPS